jgi:hypothetical protein
MGRSGSNKEPANITTSNTTSTIQGIIRSHDLLLLLTPE